MSVASSYAKALHESVTEEPAKGALFIKNLRASLTKRGHLKLVPNIVSEYQKLEVGAERSTRHSKVTPEKERVRILLGLYRKLVETK